MSKCVVVLEDKVVLYQRERSSVWQACIKLDDGKWHRVLTKEKEQDKAHERALELFFESRAKSQSKLPQVSRRFKSVAKSAIQQMEDDLKAGRGRVVYKAYIAALNKTLIPYFGHTKIDNITPAKLEAFSQWRREQYNKELPASTITNHNSALNRIFDIAVQHGWATRNSLPQLINKSKRSDVRPTFSFQEYRLLVRRMREWMKQGHKKRTLYMRELLRDYVLVLANTGMRHGTEAFNLKWKVIDWYVNGEGARFIQMTVDGKTGNRQLIARNDCEIYLNRIKNRFVDLKDLALDDKCGLISLGCS